MINLRNFIVFFLAAWMASGCSEREPKASRTVTYSELISALTDTRALADLSSPASRIITSYDRKGGNDDYNNPLSQAKDGWVVLADLKGPGYVSRFWFTGSEDGTYPVRFFFDGEKTARLDTTVGELCGGKEPFLEPLAAYDAFCWYSLVPIPYQKRLVVMTKAGGYKPDGWPRIFYQINYNDAPADATVESFPRDMTPELKSQITAARAQLDNPGTLSDAKNGDSVQLLDGMLAAGGSAKCETVTGPAILREIRIRLDLSPLASFSARQQAMREIHLRIFWDDATAPSVEVPLGDFFGSVGQRRQFQNVYFGLTGDTFVARFPMPFEKSARIEISNSMPADLPVAVTVVKETLPAWSSSWGYFHACWRKTTPAQVGQPHVFVDARGRGRFVGCLLSTLSMDKSWWMLEGDESIRVDDESFPSWHGTGLEDYFNGGWYYGSALIRPYSGLPFKAQFRTVQYRIHHADPVAFKTALHAQIERGPDNASQGFMESVAYYYLDKPQQADSSLGDANFRSPPRDPLAGGTVMTEINEFERLGDLRGAREYIGTILEIAPNYQFAEILRLRLLGYEAEENGYVAIADRMTAMLASTNAMVRRQAEDLQWFHEDPSHAILGTYCNTPVQVYMDGQAMGTTADPERFTFQRVVLSPGQHAIALKTRYRPYPFWVLADLKTHQGHIGTQREWKYDYPSGQTWANTDFDDSSWLAVGGARQGKGPPEEPYIFLEPHAYIGMQAGTRGIWVPTEWADKNRWAVFRKSFTTGSP